MDNRDTHLRTILSILEKEGITGEEFAVTNFDRIPTENLANLSNELSKISVDYDSKDTAHREELTNVIQQSLASTFGGLLHLDQALLKASERADQKHAEDLLK